MIKEKVLEARDKLYDLVDELIAYGRDLYKVSGQLKNGKKPDLGLLKEKIVKAKQFSRSKKLKYNPLGRPIAKGFGKVNLKLKWCFDRLVAGEVGEFEDVVFKLEEEAEELVNVKIRIRIKVQEMISKAM